MSVFKDHYLKKHLSENCQILLRPDGERGIFTSQDLKSGDLLFRDRPLLLGPKNAVTAVQCSCCYKSNADLKPCIKGCSLPLCKDCSKGKEEHEQDCGMLRNLGICDTNSWSLNVLRALTPLRALRLQEKDKNVLKLLKSLKNILTRDELDSFLRLLDNPNIIYEQDIEFMHQVCSILQTNSFEVPVVNCGVEISYIRGIYPMAAMLNHSCAPNVRHSFVKEKAEDSVKGGVQFSPILEFRARQDVKCGEELFITYCDITDVTSVRLKKLSLTKGFLCKCPRCSDRTEFGTNISAFKCANQDKDCAGMMLPQEPLKLSTDYICISCNFILNKDLVEDYQKSATALLATLKNGQLDKVIKFLQKNKESNWLPQCSFVYIKLKMHLISNLGHQEGFQWHELMTEHLLLKKQACDDILQFLTRVNYCKSTLYGSVLHEAQKCIRHLSQTESDIKLANDYLNEAKDILKNDVTVVLDDY